MGQKYANLSRVDRLLTLSPRYVTVTCLTYRDGVEERGEWKVSRNGSGGEGATKCVGGRVEEH